MRNRGDGKAPFTSQIKTVRFHIPVQFLIFILGGCNNLEVNLTFVIYSVSFEGVFLPF